MNKDLRFYKATEVDEAVELLTDKKLKLLAGGTDFMVDLRNEEDFLNGYEGILDLSNLNDLKNITENDDHIEIGAMVTHRNIVESDLIREYYPALAQSAAAIGSTQIRNRATIGGNICNAAACADTLGPLIAFEARAVLKSVNGMRTMDVSEFVKWPYETELNENEILVSFILPKPEEGTYSGFQKIGRRQALAITRISLAVTAVIESGTVIDINLVPGSATPVPTTFSKVEAEIKGKKLSEIDSEEIGEKAAEEMIGITGERWSTPYKKPALATLFRRAIKNLQEEVANNG
ncbi:MAG: FAD binding domain-containing protein [Bacillota bacterium]